MAASVLRLARIILLPVTALLALALPRFRPGSQPTRTRLALAFLGVDHWAWDALGCLYGLDLLTNGFDLSRRSITCLRVEKVQQVNSGLLAGQFRN